MKKLISFVPLCIALVLIISACTPVAPPPPPTSTATQPPPTNTPTLTYTPSPTKVTTLSGELYEPFEGEFALGWTWTEENPAKWSLTEKPGFLGIYLGPYESGGQNFLLMPVEGADFNLTTRLVFEPYANFQFAGLIVFVENGITAKFGRAYCDITGPCVGNGLYFDYVEEGRGVGSNFATSLDNKSEAWLSLDRQGDSLLALYSPDGKEWVVIGTHTLSPYFQNVRVGLFAWQDNDKSDDDIAAYFDHFYFLGRPKP